jgi:DNA-binding response OmpR family regulator
MAVDNISASETSENVANQILLVEDEVETAAYIQELLEQRGYRVDVARDAGQAQSQFAVRKPDFIILDLILPGQSGFELCDRFKQIEKSVPILILSVIDLEDSRRLADKVGADGYLTKPVDPDELIETISRISQAVWNKNRSGVSADEQTQRVHFTCSCGKRFRVRPAHRGKSLTCPDCGETVTVPRHD